MQQSRAFEASARAAHGLMQRSSGGEHSLSGGEWNRFFLNLGGEAFADLSTISGMAHPGDGRSVVVWDYDHDGFQDIVSINANGPKLVWYQNALASYFHQEAGNQRHFLAIRLRGGNVSSTPSSAYSARDGYGTQLCLKVNGRQLIAESRCGEGFSAQNSRTLIIGLGSAQEVETLEVRWPSGIVQRTSGPLVAGQLLTVFENPEDSPNQTPWHLESYTKAPPAMKSIVPSGDRFALTNEQRPNTATLRLYVLTATWCQACRKELPWLRELRKRFSDHELAIIGLPGDPKETASELEAFAQRDPLPYELVSTLSAGDRQRMDALLEKSHHPTGALPAAILTDAHGMVHRVAAHAPTLSEIRQAHEKAIAFGAGAPREP